MPHLTIDPVVVAAKIVTELQTIVSRELDPQTPGVVSITTIHGVEAYNVIPQSVTMRGTMRALSVETLQQIQQRVVEIAALGADQVTPRADHERRVERVAGWMRQKGAGPGERVLLHLPSLWMGFYVDDHVHQLALEGELALEPWALYDFGTFEDWSRDGGA